MTDVLSVAIAPCGFRRDHIGLLIAPGSATAHTESVTSDVALQFATSMLRRFDVDWDAAGFSDDGLNELAEHLLRIIQSFVIDPGRPHGRARIGATTCGGGSAQRWASSSANTAAGGSTQRRA
jgi:hypothetical protein